MDPTTPVLALDQGGGSTRGLVFGSGGELLGHSRRRVDEVRSGGGRVEQDPEAVLESLLEVATELRESTPTLARAGLATQRSSLVAWDRRSGEALSPILSWQDTRGAEWLVACTRDPEVRAEIRRRTGLLASPHYGASKIRWCLDHLPAVARARSRGTLAIGPVASFFAFRLLEGRPLVVDPANASRTLLWNHRNGSWDRWLLERFQVPPEILPVVVPSAGPLGRLAEVDLPLTALLGDQGAALFAGGTPSPAAIAVNLGTGAFLQRLLPVGEDDAPAGWLLGVAGGSPSRPVRSIEGSVHGAGAALRALAHDLGHPNLPIVDQWLNEIAAPPLFLNAVSGLGSPWWRSDLGSRFAGRDRRPEARAVAVVESIAFLVAENVHGLSSVPPEPTRLVVSGGLAVLDGLCQRLADLTGLVVERPDLVEATGRGTAAIAAERSWPLGPGRHFSPRSAPELRDRHDAWRRLLQEALASGGDSGSLPTEERG